MPTRDIRADYVRAYTEQYDAYQRAGDKAGAQRVAEILRAEYGHEVAAPKPETADADPAPEAAVEETATPKKRGRPRTTPKG